MSYIFYKGVYVTNINSCRLIVRDQGPALRHQINQVTMIMLLIRVTPETHPKSPIGATNL